MNFDRKLIRLEDIVAKMEGGDLALEDSLKMFEEGVKLVRDCQVQLSAAEQKVKVLMSVDSEGRAVTTDFSEKE